MKTNYISKDSKDYYISYNPLDVQSYGDTTTALHINETSQFLILNGNHTEQYNNCKDLKECLKYFYSKKEAFNKRSEHGTVFRMIEGKAKYIKGGY